MSFRKPSNLILLFLFLFVLSPVSGWQNDKNLEKSFILFKSLFESKKLYKLYNKHADISLKKELAETVQNIKKDRGTAGLVAKRLRFDSLSDFNRAGSDLIIKKMIFNMQNPPDKPRDIINNSYYIESFLTLSLIFAPYDKNLTIDKKEVKGNSAVVDFSYKDFKVSAYYLLRKKNWYITTKKFIL